MKRNYTKYTKELLEPLVKESFSFSNVCKLLGIKPIGSNPTTIRRKLDEFNIDYSHFTGKVWNVYGNPNFGNGVTPLNEFFADNTSADSAKVKLRLLNNKLKEYRCECCGITEWNGQPITLQLHHINGKHTDNRLENLQLLCPNCHSQTHNYCKQKCSI